MQSVVKLISVSTPSFRTDLNLFQSLLKMLNLNEMENATRCFRTTLNLRWDCQTTLVPVCNFVSGNNRQKRGGLPFVSRLDNIRITITSLLLSPSPGIELSSSYLFRLVPNETCSLSLPPISLHFLRSQALGASSYDVHKMFGFFYIPPCPHLELISSINSCNLP